MSNYIETSVRYAKTCEDGKVKKVTERYLVAADCFTEAEAIATRHLADSIGGEFAVSAVRKSNIAEVIPSLKQSVRYYKVKVRYITLDERSGAEKSAYGYYLVAVDEGGSIHSATAALDIYLSVGPISHEITAIAKTPIVGVLKYEAREKGVGE